MTALRSIAGWGLALFLIAMFVQATLHPLPNPPEGQVKLFDAAGQNIVFATMASKTGIGFLEPTGRVIVAIMELFVAFMLLIPAFRRAGAVFSFLIVAGAVAAHLLPNVLGREVPLALTGGAGTDGGQLFALAIAMLAASMLLIVVHPGRSRD